MIPLRDLPTILTESPLVKHQIGRIPPLCGSSLRASSYPGWAWSLEGAYAGGVVAAQRFPPGQLRENHGVGAWDTQELRRTPGPPALVVPQHQQDTPPLGLRL